MKKLLLIISMTLLSFGLTAQDFDWVKDLSESSPDFEGTNPNAFEVVDIEIDANDNVYVLGNFRGVVDVAPGSQTLFLTSQGGVDLFITKYDSDGNLIDSFTSGKPGSASDERANDMVMSDDGYLYITGSFESGYYFWPYWQESDVDLDCDCSYNMFVAKMDTNFYVYWAKEPYSCYEDMDSEYIAGEVITAKGTDEIYVGGHFYGIPQIVDGENFSSNDSKNDLFYAKIDSDGNYQWGKEIKSNSDNQEYITGIAAGNYLYITGSFNDEASVDMNPSSTYSYNLTSTGDYDIFLGMYYLTTGNFIGSAYVGEIGSTYYDYTMSIDLDAQNNVYLSGYTSGSADLNIKSGTQNNTGGFVAKYSFALTYQWKIGFGSSVKGVAKIDEDGDIIVNGRYTGTKNFNPNGSAYNMSTTGSNPNIYFGKYNSSSGEMINVRSIGGNKSMGTIGNSAYYYAPKWNNLFLLGCSKHSTSFVVYGKYKELLDFDPGEGINLASPASYEDGRYFAKYSHCYPTVITTQTQGEEIYCEGENLSAYVQATGSNLSYKWYIDSDPRDDGYSSYGDINGTETNHLSIGNVTYQAGGMPYNCKIMSSCADPVFSNELDVEVNRLPEITSHPTGVTACEGADINLTVGTQYANSYQWMVNNGSGVFQPLNDNATYSGTQTANLTITNIQPEQTYYQYKCYVSGNCPPQLYSNPATLIVNPNPNIQSHPVDAEVCVGSSANFSVSTSGSGLTYQWQSSYNGGITYNNLTDNSGLSGAQTSTLTLNNASLVINGYKYRCIVSGSCGNDITSNAAELTVKPSTSIISHPLDVSSCEYDNASFNINASGSSLSYRWQVNTGSGWTNLSNGGFYSNVTNSTLNISYLDAALDGNLYRCVISSECSSNVYSNAGELTVYTLPNITVSSAEGSDICDLESSLLSITGGNASYTYQWKRNFSAISGANSDNLTVTQSGAYSLYAENAIGCSSESDPISINVHPLPNADISVFGDTEFCEGSYAELFIQPGSAYTYEWHNSNGIIANALSNSLVVSEAEVYHALITNMYGCQNTSSPINITVNELPVVSASTSVSEICDGETTTITGTSNSDYTYQWKKNNILIPGETSNSITTGQAGNYTLYAKTSEGCSAETEAVNINVHNLPNAALSVIGDAEFCQGSYAELFVQPGSAYTYEWHNSNGTITGASSNTLIVSEANAYHVVITSAHGCQNTSNSVSITVNDLPTLSLSAPETDICNGESTTITGTFDANYTYQWKKNNTLLPSETSNSITVNASGNYSLYAETSEGCSFESEPLTINVHNAPNASITVIGNTEFCEGSHAELFVPSGNGYTYQWYNSSAPISGSNSQSFVATETGNYSAVVTNTYGCESTSEVRSITAHPLPVVSLSATNVELCEGESASLSVDEVANYFYQWKRNNLDVSGAGSSALEVDNAGLYNVDVLDASTGCSFTSEYATVLLNALPQPEIQASGELVYCVDDAIELSLTENYNHYLWTGGVSTSSLTVDAANTYQVTVTDANGCSNSTSYEVIEDLVETPNICMVTVDTALNKNLVVWEHLPDNPGVASYNVYKLVNSQYQLIGNILYNDTTEFVDMTSEPDIHADIYAIASVDSCGSISSYSPYHQTMNLGIAEGTQGDVVLSWTKYIDESGLNNPTEYQVYRGVDNLAYYTSVTGGLSSYTVVVTDVQEDERFWIVVQRPMGCAPLNTGAKANGGPYYQSVSNVEDEGVLDNNPTSVANIAAESIKLYPNPAKDYVSISSDKTNLEVIKVYNLLGQLILKENHIVSKSHKLDIKQLSKGTYIIEINNTYKQQLIVE